MSADRLFHLFKQHQSIALLCPWFLEEPIRMFPRTDDQFWSHLLDDSPGKVRRRGVINWNHDHPAVRASEERTHPRGTVLAPEHDAVALGNMPRVQLTRESISSLCDLAIRPARDTVTDRFGIGDFLA